MPSISISREGRAARGWRTRMHEAFVGRPIGQSATFVLQGVNALAFVACVYGLWWVFMGAAMAAGTLTPAVDLWLGRAMFALLLGMVGFGRAGWQLLHRRAWPWAFQLMGIVAVVALALLFLFAPPGIFTSTPGA